MKPKKNLSEESVPFHQQVEETVDNLLAIDLSKANKLITLSAIMSRLEQNVSFERILLAQSERRLLNFNRARLSSDDTIRCCKAISRIIERLVLSNSYDWSSEQISSVAVDIFFLCNDWNLADAAYFAYHIRANPGNNRKFSFKGAMRPSELLSLIPAYNELRSIEHERLAHVLAVSEQTQAVNPVNEIK